MPYFSLTYYHTEVWVIATVTTVTRGRSRWVHQHLGPGAVLVFPAAGLSWSTVRRYIDPPLLHYILLITPLLCQSAGTIFPDAYASPGTPFLDACECLGLIPKDSLCGLAVSSESWEETQPYSLTCQRPAQGRARGEHLKCIS